MKRAHYNQTNQPITFRTWVLRQDHVGEDDFIWLKAFDIPIRIDDGDQWIDTSKGRFRVQGQRTITLDTTTDKQRDMLVLKYGNALVLVQEETLLPNMMSFAVKDY